ncbi:MULTISPECIES: dephospho-CoA kinase [Pseudomonadati]|uniref:Dephospho-CoA kinase n=1 Tax=Shewanella aestuarii TaxID=1028752 RepID=A0ABT0L4I7_9GAMM|nr:dephospho-CoA kinase [Shewanella aestuarii]MCL1118648.1 dephospho-CoA kinase [Shewanella aestuarii]GGN80658.1 dephospho-CoA kinase [Shewanella aestuarii]
MAKFIVGLTGGIGSGKTTVANLFAELGITLVDADIVAREVVAKGSEGLTRIIEHFGADVCQIDGSLNRIALREIIFNQPHQRDWLNNLLHPMIRNTMLKQVQQADSAYVIMVVPLLFENGLDKLVNTTLVVDVDPKLQISRTSERDKVASTQVEQIILSQMPRDQRLSKADDIIDNQGQLNALRSKVASLHHKYLELAKTPN